MPTDNLNKKVTQSLEARAKFIQSLLSDVTFAAMKTGMALMKQRIFNNGLDADKRPLAPYISRPYIRKRAKAGRQTIKKDLQFSGSLNGGIETRKTAGIRSNIQFTTDELALIGRAQESQVANIRSSRKGRGTSQPVDIFTLNDDEQVASMRVMRELFKQVLK